MPLMQRLARCRPIPMRLAVVVFVSALVSGCGVGRGFSGSGNGFGGIGGTRVAIPQAEADGYTMRRLQGRDDELVGLQPDPTVRWPDPSDENRPSVFETDDERRAREARERPQQSRRGSSSESRDLPREQPQDLVRPAPDPRLLAAPPADPRGQAIPGAPAGTVGTGSTGPNTGTFGGPAGSGTVIRDGGTTTLMGADGTIRMVPTPR